MLFTGMNAWKVGAHDMGACLRGIYGAVNKYGHSEMIYASMTLISKARIVLDATGKGDCPPLLNVSAGLSLPLRSMDIVIRHPSNFDQRPLAMSLELYDITAQATATHYVLVRRS